MQSELSLLIFDFIRWMLIFFTFWPVMLSLGIIFYSYTTEEQFRKDTERIKKNYNKRNFIITFYIFAVGQKSRWLMPILSIPLWLLFLLFNRLINN
jgi:hypothetical protein